MEPQITDMNANRIEELAENKDQNNGNDQRSSGRETKEINESLVR